ncbi:hypothetical protein SNE40_021422 [Patella caerulea]|uniref:Thioredoxin domain-containing protein n=1 Tax=Patella caerulea TaxID=87958 RepID=A0AAN8FZH7_PATCE
MAASSVYVLLLSLFSCIALYLADGEHGDQVKSLKADTFEEAVSSKRYFIMFYAPWCGHCKRLGPTWNELAELYNDLQDSPVVIAKVDCTEETPLCAQQDITGYPTLKYFYDSPTDYIRYKGNRDLSSFKSFLEDQHRANEEEDDPQPPEPKKHLQILEKDMDEVIKYGHYFVKFYAPWCGHCQKLAPVWDDLARTFEFNPDVNIAKIDCQEYGTVCGMHGITGYPTLIYYIDGQKVETYNGGRTHEELKEFVSRMMSVKDDEDKERTDEKIPEEIEPESEMIELSDATYDEVIAEKTVFVKFYAPWCGHCKRLAPTWLELAQIYSGRDDVIIADVDCTRYSDICKNNQIRGYPTLILLRNGVRVQEYSGSRTLDSLQSFVDSHLHDRDEL